MSVKDMRETFQQNAGDPIRCIGVRMRLTDDRKGTILEFDIVQDGKQRTVVAPALHPSPHGPALHVAVAKIAADVVAGKL